jgi:molybdenum cofactor cytidylyltransferase
MTCDMPAVTAGHLRKLVAFEQIAASSHGGRNGVPAHFPSDRFPELLDLRGDVGARQLLQSAHKVELPSGGLDIDTPAEIAS